jgi:hypothetical protein
VGNLFLVIYTLFFGAVLSAEISNYHFSGLHLYSSTTKPVARLVMRAMFLVVLRLVYLGWAYSTLMGCLSLDHHLPFFFQPIICAVLSSPIFGIAQLSYRFEPPPVVDPPEQKFSGRMPISCRLRESHSSSHSKEEIKIVKAKRFYAYGVVFSDHQLFKGHIETGQKVVIEGDSVLRIHSHRDGNVWFQSGVHANQPPKRTILSLPTPSENDRGCEFLVDRQ